MKTNKITTSGILCAFAYILMLVSKLIPEVAGFLQFDLKDVIIVIGGFMLGPVYAFIISVVVALLELLTASNTGAIGLLMNIISSVAFCCTASLIYKHFRTLKGAISSLVIGTLIMTAVMIMWNYFITPRYMQVPREVVVSMLVPVFLPFNLSKGLVVSIITMLTYKKISFILKK